MTKSESKALAWIKEMYPGAITLKIPDFKQTGLINAQGYPDYLINYNGVFYVEVKQVSGSCLRASDFTPAQMVMFPRLLQAGARIQLIVYHKGGRTLSSVPKTFDNNFILALE